MAVHNACMTLEVAQIAPLRSFLESLLGFECRWELGDWCEMSLGDFRLALRRNSAAAPAASQAALGVGVKGGLEPFHADLLAVGAQIDRWETDAVAKVRLLHFLLPGGYPAYAWEPIAKDPTP